MLGSAIERPMPADGAIRIAAESQEPNACLLDTLDEIGKSGVLF